MKKTITRRSVLRRRLRRQLAARDEGDAGPRDLHGPLGSREQEDRLVELHVGRELLVLGRHARLEQGVHVPRVLLHDKTFCLG